MKRYLAIIILILAAGVVSFAQSPEDYFQTAAENNPGLLAKYKEYEAALQKIPQVSSLSDPAFSFGYFISPAETRSGPQRAKFSLVQMFPWFGTLKSQGDVAALRAEAKFQNFLDARNKLWFQVASVYY
ncbi:MAG: TolC family protein, partial [Bacteroidales bacterium]|nr:TolC family protein [Bacteroidales bacterium]